MRVNYKITADKDTAHELWADNVALVALAEAVRANSETGCDYAVHADEPGDWLVSLEFDTRLHEPEAIAADLLMAQREIEQHAVMAMAYAAKREDALEGLPFGFDIPADCEGADGRLLFGEFAKYRAEIADMLRGWPRGQMVPAECFDENGRLVKRPMQRETREGESEAA